VVNGNFEKGTDDWIEFPTTGESIIRTDRPHRGNIGAWFGGFDNAHDWIVGIDSFYFPRKDGGLSGDLVRGSITAAVVMSSSENGRETDVLSLLIRGRRSEFSCDFTTDEQIRDQWVDGGCEFTDQVKAVFSDSYVDVVVRGVTSPRRPTGWAVDDVTVELCTRW
jgi:hypothetical protein